jgi:hypothetical protein
VIRGYVEQPSPRPGELLSLRVSTDAPRFRVEFYRYGSDAQFRTYTDWLVGRDVPPHMPFHDWGRPGEDLCGRALEPWPRYRLAVPADWPSGVYVAAFIEGGGTDDGRRRTGPISTDARSARALFVVRRALTAAPAPIVYKVPVLTYHAYNTADGPSFDGDAGQWCLYNTPEAVPAGVSLHRPGGGTGGVPYDMTLNPDPFDPTPRQTFEHWDARFVSWLERTGYQVDYCTDVDLHRDGIGQLSPYRLMVSVGHDEYWSDAMRAALDDFVGAGGNAAFFGGNTCWWRVVFHDDVTFSRVAYWHEAGRPENTSIGVSFRNGGERDRDDHPVPVGYRVQHADHWIYRNTGLVDGDRFGDAPDEYLIGYECDGAEFDRSDLTAGRAVRPTGLDGTPEDFTILGVGDTRESGWGVGNGAATLGLFQRHGTVFNAATTDWARVMTAGHDRTVEQITRNVLDRLS